MRINILIINIIVFLITGTLHSQSVNEDKFKSNLDIYSGLLNKNLDGLGNRLVLLGRDKIYSITINAKPDVREYLYLKIRQRLNNFRIISESDSSISDFIVKFEDVKFVTKYEKIFGSVLNNRKVQRRIEISYKSLITSKDKDSVLYKNNIFDVNNDDFYFDNIDAVERGDYNFLKGTLPNQSFLEKAFVPGLVIVASAVTVILFFVIRSK
jgi:hypothetical protein